jgi:hypothetical protein
MVFERKSYDVPELPLCRQSENDNCMLNSLLVVLHNITVTLL